VKFSVLGQKKRLKKEKGLEHMVKSKKQDKRRGKKEKKEKVKSE
jgi:hypothetical protein